MYACSCRYAYSLFQPRSQNTTLIQFLLFLWVLFTVFWKNVPSGSISSEDRHYIYHAKERERAIKPRSNIEIKTIPQKIHEIMVRLETKFIRTEACTSCYHWERMTLDTMWSNQPCKDTVRIFELTLSNILNRLCGLWYMPCWWTAWLK